MLHPINWSLALPYYAAALAFGYLLGSIPFGLILTRIAGTTDIRSIGSGNIGATNVLRTGRKGLAAATLLADLLKGTVAVLVMSWLWGRGALEHVTEERRRGEPLAAGAQHIGGADIAGADAADVGRAGQPRDDEAKRNRAEQVAERERGGIIGQGEGPADRMQHEAFA